MTSTAPPRSTPLVEHFALGLDAPICLTWELTYACNLACSHCLSSSGRRDPRELTHRRVQGRHRRAAADAGVLRQHRRRRADGAQRLLGAARLRHRARRRREVLHQRHPDRRRGGPADRRQRLRRRADLDRRRDRRGQRRGPRRGLVRHRRARAAAPGRRRRAGQDLGRLHPPEHRPARRVQGDRRPLRRPAAAHPAAPLGPRRRRLGRAAPHARRSSASSTTGCVAHGEDVLTGDSFFHLAAYGEALPGLNLCGAGRVVCLIDPVGDVYACPFAIHDQFLAGNVRDRGRLRRRVARERAVPRAARAAVRRRLLRLQRLRRLPRRLHGGEVLHRAAARRPRPRVRQGPRRARPGRGRARRRRRGPSLDHSPPRRRAAAGRSRSP